MQFRNAILSTLQLFAGFAFFAAAIFFYALPFLPKVRLQIASALFASPKASLPIATALMSVSFVLIGGFYALSRGRSLTVSMGKGSSTSVVSTEVIQKTLEECFKAHFNGLIVLSDISIMRKNKIEIEVRLTPFEENLREDLFVAVQGKITPLLEERFGYSKPFCFIVKSS